MIIKKKENLGISSDNDKKKFLIVGLGNPGYSGTRHNVGSDLLFLITQNLNKKIIEKNLFLCEIGDNIVLVLLNPSVMNISGNNVSKVFRQYNCTDLIVVSDDLDTKLGKIKCSFSVADGGQKGVRSIIEKMGHNHFWRIKIGIDRPNNKEEVSQYVLEKFSTHEKTILFQNIDNLKESILKVLTK